MLVGHWNELFLGFQNCGLTSVSPCQVRKVLSDFYVFRAPCHELCLVRLLTQEFLCLHHDRASVRSRPFARSSQTGENANLIRFSCRCECLWNTRVPFVMI